MKEPSLREYFAGTPAWRRQLAQLRKKCLAGYADDVIRLSDATAQAVLQEKRAGYQEALAEHYLEDLRKREG